MVLPQITIDWMEAYEALGPLALIMLGITVYGVFVFNFYRFLARKDIITLNLQKHNQAKRPALRKTITVIFYIFKCLVLYPVFVFFWFSVMAGLLYVLSRNHTTETVMLVAMGVVGAIRICAYYKDALATDIAKILPFALLGIMLIDNSIVRIVQSAEGVREAALQWETVVYYLVAVVTIEFVLRMTSGIFGLFKSRRRSRKERKEQVKPEVEPTGPRFGTPGTVFEPRPVGLGSASPMASNRPRLSPRPSFLEGRADVRRGANVESSEPDGAPETENMPKKSGWGLGRPAYASSMETEPQNTEWNANGGRPIG